MSLLVILDMSLLVILDMSLLVILDMSLVSTFGYMSFLRNSGHVSS